MFFLGVFNDLVFYFQYASSAYANVCARPNGNTLVQQVVTIHIRFAGLLPLPRLSRSRKVAPILKLLLRATTPAERLSSRYAAG